MTCVNGLLTILTKNHHLYFLCLQVVYIIYYAGYQYNLVADQETIMFNCHKFSFNYS